MIVLNQVKKELETYLSKYHHKIARKHLVDYLRFFSEEILENYYDKSRRESYQKFLKYKKDCFVRMKDDEIYFNKKYEKYPYVLGKFYNSEQQRIRMHVRIKEDFQELGYIEMTSNGQKLKDEENGTITSTKELFKVNLPEDMSCYIDEENDHLDFWDESWDFQELDGDYLILYKDVLKLQHELSTEHFVRIYSQFIRLKRIGFVIYNNQRENDTGYRIYHSFSFLNEKLRALIRDSDSGELFKSIDLVSSHVYWLAERTKHVQLYEDVKSKTIKQFNKKLLLQWLNSQNYTANCYGKINTYFKSINLDTSKLRDEKGLYNTLAKMEGDYVIGDISKRFKLPNFTVHDQIYYLERDERKLGRIINGMNSRFCFPPIWSFK